LIFALASNDIGRLDEARNELHKLLEEDKLRDVILLVYQEAGSAKCRHT
jgi:hypothetical protein